MVASLIVALALTAGEGPVKPNPHLDVAAEQIRGFKELEALQTLEQSKRWPWNSPRDLALTNLYIGWAHAELGRETEALEAFRMARLLDPNVPFPRDVSPRLEALWVKSRGVLAQADQAPAAPGPEVRDPGDVTSGSDAPGDAPTGASAAHSKSGDPVSAPAAEGTPSPSPLTDVAPVAAQSAEDARPRWPRWMATGAIAVGVAAAIGGVFAGGSSRSHLDRSFDEPRVDRAEALHRRAAEDARLANVLFGAGAAVGAGGAVTLLLTF